MERQMKTRFSLLLIVAAMLALGGCMGAAEVAASDEAACRSTGTKPGTPAHAKCLENRKDRRRRGQQEAGWAQQRMMFDAQQSAQRAAMPRM